MTENETFIYESIIKQVRAGFDELDYIKDNIIEEIEDNEFENEISEDWAINLIDAEFKILENESKNWNRPNDVDKLIKAFDDLCKANINALHNAGYENSDGEYEVVQVEIELNKNGVKSDGYCFYHGQDVEGVIANNDRNLYLAFNKVDNEDDEISIAIGKRIVEILKQNDFNVAWNEKVTTKIEILNFKWQNIYNESNRDLLNYEAVIELMKKNN
jgi:hypothetical protein